VSADGLLYLHSSALAKLVAAEPETGALIEFLRGHPEHLTCEIAGIEVRRAARRVDGQPNTVKRADRVMASVALLRLREEILEQAGRLAPATLGALDSIHLAAALSLGDALGTFVAYDERLLDAARSVGLHVASPGRE
jgi:predicted nucleic acid-binding protein